MHCLYECFWCVGYNGYYSVATVTSLASALSLFMSSFKSPDYTTVILVVARNWNWDALFEPILSKHARYFTRPLAWQYKTSAEPGQCAGARYRDWGDASQHWLGEEGKADGDSLQFLTELPDPATFMPVMLPLREMVSDKLKEDVKSILESGFCSVQEAEQCRLLLSSGGDLSRLVRVTGQLFAGGLPGKPGLVECTDKFGKRWSAEVRLIDALPSDLWSVPASRLRAVASHEHLTAAEEKLLSHTAISTQQPTVSHPRFHPNRALTETEAEVYRRVGSRTPVQDYVESSESKVTLEELSSARFTMPDLKAYLSGFGMATGGKKAELARRVFEHARPSAGREQGAGRGRGHSRGRGAGRGQGRGRARGASQPRGRARARSQPRKTKAYQTSRRRRPDSESDADEAESSATCSDADEAADVDLTRARSAAAPSRKRKVAV